MIYKKALVTLALLVTLISTGTPLLAQGGQRRVLVEQVVNSPRDQHSGVIFPRDPASGMPTGILSPRDSVSGNATGITAPRDTNSGLANGT